uniref:Uncharacterized protein n=1 Tax=Anguilla anguilla TaxID=7936 RepID=A0A0E9S3N9_ANGAN
MFIVCMHVCSYMHVCAHVEINQKEINQ